MRQDPSNPSRNCLPKGIAEEDLVSAIGSSGYPLQGLVASKLNELFGVSEEWGYIDRDSKEHRTLDVYAYKQLSAGGADSVKPCLAILIECKRSQHPYIFFKNVTERPIPQFPAISGLRRGSVWIYEKSMKRSQVVPGATVLGIDKVPFVEPGPPKCSALSKAIPSGKKVELSGSDPFNSLILPLVRALDHATDLYRADEKPTTLYPTLLFCVSVIDAPMILVDSPEKASEPTLCPWVRVVRQEANADPRSRVRFRYYAMDAVHIDFFEEFLHKNLLPFADTFSDRARQLEGILFKDGVVDSLDKWEWDQIRPKSG